MKAVATPELSGVRGWSEKPFTERDPAQTCFTCRFTAKERTGPLDIHGQVVCKWGPKHVTSLPQPNGLIGISAHPAVRPEEWCYRWEGAPDAVETAARIVS